MCNCEWFLYFVKIMFLKVKSIILTSKKKVLFSSLVALPTAPRTTDVLTPAPPRPINDWDPNISNAD